VGDVTVITPSLPERSALLRESCRSVAAQTLPPVVHLIGVDYGRRGPATIRQELLTAVGTEWVAFLDDDDVLDPNHLATLMAHADGFDVVGSYCRFDGPPIPAKFCNRAYDRDVLRRHNIMPITFLARAAAIMDADGFRPEDRYEDWSMLNRMADNGCSFNVVPWITWTYRTATPHRRTHEAA
jgi:glycosyltransferase involved in cell wall biosynthesis